ncbi:hypothetical protein [Streptomyces sp. NPDC003832]
MTTYSEGAQVKYKGMSMPATVISGPHETVGASRWLIRKADGNVTLARESELTALPTQRERVAQAIVKASTASATWDTMGPAARVNFLRLADAAISAMREGEVKDVPLSAGDLVRVLTRRLSGADVRVGDTLTVAQVGTKLIRVRSSRSLTGYYVFQQSDRGTGWERV